MKSNVQSAYSRASLHRTLDPGRLDRDGAGPARAEALADDQVRRIAGRRMAGHGADERVAIERVEREVGHGTHRRRPGHVAEQRDLAEPASLLNGFRSPVDEHLRT